MNAAEKCKDRGMSLPEFLSRRDQEELLYLLKSTSDDTSIFPVKAVFIGLYGSASKVETNPIFSQDSISLGLKSMTLIHQWTILTNVHTYK